MTYGPCSPGPPSTSTTSTPARAHAERRGFHAIAALLREREAPADR
ncbi:hypothetical protein ACH4ND_22215 [Streptomyces sp. NPDC017179]